jgi:hypothetical protein
LITQVRYRADVTGYTTRHTDEELTQYLYDSYQRLREFVTNCGSRRFLSKLLATSATTSASGDGVEYVIPVDHISSVQWYDGARWRELERLVYSDALEFEYQGTPRFWSSVGPASEGGTGTRVTLYPFLASSADDANPDVVRAIGVYPLSAEPFATLSLDQYGYDWIILDAASRVMMRNADSKGTYQLMLLEREKAEKQIRQSVMSENLAPAQRGIVRPGR